MCGIAGFLDPGRQRSPEAMRRDIVGMTNSLVHRGPDDGGAWVDPVAGVALGNRRLAIIDLSPEGHQPMHSASGRFVIAYNGEIYNSAAIARALESAGLAPGWRGHSDTEVMLAAIEAWGLDRALKSFNGMFAFALWDARERTLCLVRDRLGVKPLYYGCLNGALVFGSELKAISAYPDAMLTIDRDWLDRYLREIHRRSEDTIYRGVRAVCPGTYVTFNQKLQAHERVYWSATDQAEIGYHDRFSGSEAEATERLDNLLRDAVRLRTVSDVPLGVLLSGGIDSSTILALLQQESPRAIRSFSIGFPDQSLDEAPAARKIAAHIGSDHTELYMAPNDIIELIPSLARLSDQPQSDPSYVSNHVAYRLAGQSVTVTLCGDGGDELFAGYHRHRWLPRVCRQLGWVPVGIRKQMAQALTAIPPGTWDKVFGIVEPAVPSRLRERTPGAKLHRMARWMGSASDEEMYRVLSTRWDPGDRLVVGHDLEQPRTDAAFVRLNAKFGILERMLAHELVTTFVDTQLKKVDRASMAVSVEARAPFMDYRVVEFSFTLPPDLKVRGETGKYILRRVLHRYVPEALYQRPKMGFHLPLSTWLRGPLRDWAEDLLHPSSIRQEGLLNPDPIRVKWHEHLSGQRDRADHLWPVLMLRSWLKHHRPDVSTMLEDRRLLGVY
ncbi:Asparagine synthase (Glutamine-hydrolyzing) [Bradyrhizobium sp. STM 3843]|uniref:asparagine synthase (glutamine-hydrolyzing) n=1 Tax=Bradyrhizobium sp. STM 3843 TaxID=551947 RepID=UPI000240AADF|nr:asparagine synthase (glutamine-hydrolyzing) [Bradyrhizobium sp. STM 3843]CCE05606.1 Asparagine synthase (Glutamine-hydrolyzing) [Bradyrhizobium sp. STM 3843]